LRRYLFPQQQVSLSREDARTCLPASQRDTRAPRIPNFAFLRLSRLIALIERADSKIIPLPRSSEFCRNVPPEMLREEIFVQFGPFDHLISEIAKFNFQTPSRFLSFPRWAKFVIRCSGFSLARVAYNSTFLSALRWRDKNNSPGFVSCDKI